MNWFKNIKKLSQTHPQLDSEKIDQYLREGQQNLYNIEYQIQQIQYMIQQQPNSAAQYQEKLYYLNTQKSQIENQIKYMNELALQNKGRKNKKPKDDSGYYNSLQDFENLFSGKELNPFADWAQKLEKKLQNQN